MLVLTRKVGETVLIGDGISVTVVQLGPGSVRLGIEAPKEVPILRTEIQRGGADERAKRGPRGQ